jgi:hypothetical protein
MLEANREQIIQEVMKWIVQSGFQFESIPNTKFDFTIIFTEKETLPEMQIVHLKPETAYLLIVSQVKIPKNDRDILKNRNTNMFNQFIWNIKLNLLRFGVDFTVLGPDEFDPDAWEVQARLFFNEANTNSFYETCSMVKRALISIIWSYKRELGTSE